MLQLLAGTWKSVEGQQVLGEAEETAMVARDEVEAGTCEGQERGATDCATMHKVEARWPTYGRSA